MQTQATRTTTLLSAFSAALLGASTLAAAQTPAPAPTPTLTPPTFNTSDDIPNPKGFGDAYSLDEIRFGGLALTEEQ